MMRTWNDLQQQHEFEAISEILLNVLDLCSSFPQVGVTPSCESLKGRHMMRQGRPNASWATVQHPVVRHTGSSVHAAGNGRKQDTSTSTQPDESILTSKIEKCLARLFETLQWRQRLTVEGNALRLVWQPMFTCVLICSHLAPGLAFVNHWVSLLPSVLCDRGIFKINQRV